MQLRSCSLAIAIATSLIASILSSSCGSAVKAGRQPRHLSVLSWNIWHAGHTKYYGSKACDGIIGILKESQADVILMVETYGASQMVADSLGYDHYLISDNLCIYSRYPITGRYTFPDSISTFNFGGIEINVDGQPVRIFDTWIHYLPDERLTPTHLSEQEIIDWEKSGTRDEEINTIIATLEPMMADTDSIPIIIGGDFNSHSHLDWTEATKDMYRHGGAVVAWPVSVAMTWAGFIDSFREINPDPAKKLGVTWITEADSVETPHRSDRIDFIYYKSRNIKAVDSERYDNLLGEPFTFNGKQFFYASDHGFVLTRFQLD